MACNVPRAPLEQTHTPARSLEHLQPPSPVCANTNSSFLLQEEPKVVSLWGRGNARCVWEEPLISLPCPGWFASLGSLISLILLLCERQPPRFAKGVVQEPRKQLQVLERERIKKAQKMGREPVMPVLVHSGSCCRTGSSSVCSTYSHLCLVPSLQNGVH